jgi:hypothetical protein
LKLSSGTSEEVAARWPEEAQLGGISGMDINISGAGGVPPGTLYAATYYGGDTRIARYDPDGSFSESWTFDGNPPTERCGPDGEPAHPVCKSRPTAGARELDVEVDQSTGYLYAYDGFTQFPGIKRIHIYSADGSQLIAEFGEDAATGESTAASPGKLHGTSGYGNIALDGDGNLYVLDLNGGDNFHHRLMEFSPQSSGDYEHYVYAGQSHDVRAGFLEETPFSMNPVFDAAGYLYTTNNESIAKLDPSQPSAAPLCEFKFTKSEIIALTVNPETGEVFFYSRKDKNKIRQLGAACEETGKFSEIGTAAFSPKREEISALAFDPLRQLAPDRPPGVLYAGAPSEEGGITEGEYPDTLTEASLGYVFARPPELAPEVISESVTQVSATGARLRAQINPKGSATRYAFQYETEAQYEANEAADRFAGAKEVPLGGAFLGEGSETLSAAASIAGLTPDTAYRFRAVATSHCSSEDEEKVCEGTGADQSFHTFAIQVPGLPDRRLWELVSPALKNGGQVLPADPGIDSCFTGHACKPGGTFNRFPMQSAPDGEAIVYEGTAFAAGEGSPVENEYIARRDAKTGWHTVNLTPTLLRSTAGQGYAAFDAALSGGVLKEPNPTLSPEAPAEYENLYTQPTDDPLSLGALLTAQPPNRTPASFRLSYAGTSADLSRVFFEANDALSEETAFAPAAEDGGSGKDNLYEWERDTGQLRLVNVSPGNAEAKPGASFAFAAANAISHDGTRAFWSDEAGQLHVRESGETTRAIPGPGKFLAASSDGSKVLMSDGRLYDLETEVATDLSDGKGGFQGVAGESEDLSRLYFVDTEVLSGEEENSEGAKAQAAKFNLYAWEQGGPTRYVATLVANDNNGLSISPGRAWSSPPSGRTAEASPNGRFLTFLSQASLTGYDNTGPCEVDGETQEPVDSPCTQVFLYDSATGALSCPSCNPSGMRPRGWSVLRQLNGGGGLLPQPRYLTDEGRLYFDSRDSLVPFDTNEGVEDVYEYEPNGLGTCKREGGCVFLISAGHEAIDSNFLAMDEDGDNVFFTTRDQLALKDHDDLIDLYLARVDGGIPSETEVARPECQGEACVAALSPPNDPTPGSSSFAGAGNVDEGKAAGKHKKKHAKKRRGRKRSHGRAANHDRGGSK